MPRLVCQFLRLTFIAMVAGFSSPVLAQNCSGNELIEANFSAGSHWDMCWELRPEEGVVLKQLHYKASSGSSRVSVLGQANLAEIYVSFDDGSISAFNVTDLAGGGGLGASGNIHTLTASDCPSGTLKTAGGVAVLCRQVVPRGYSYKYYGSVQQGQALVVQHRATVGLNTYIIRWRFFEDGTIEPSVGLTGELPAVSSTDKYGWALDNTGRIGVGFNTTYYWRLDFDIGSDASNDIVEQFEVSPTANRTRKVVSRTVLTSETSRSVNADSKRSWRVRDASTTNSDGHYISYHLEPLHIGDRFTGTNQTPWALHDLHVTRYKACERFVRANPTGGGCGSTITDFVNGESINPGDIVLWYRLNYHHVPRSEDEPALPVHWDGFSILPRDWTSTNLISQLATDLPANGVEDPGSCPRHA